MIEMNTRKATRAFVRAMRIVCVALVFAPYDGLARQEWPHVPLQLARAYADEYVQTGQRP